LLSGQPLPIALPTVLALTFQPCLVARRTRPASKSSLSSRSYWVPAPSKAQRLPFRHVIGNPFSNPKLNKDYETTRLNLKYLWRLLRPRLCGPRLLGKEMKQVAPAPCPQWYSDNEWNVSLWGTYAMTGTEFAPNLDLFDLVESSSQGHTVYGTFDRYLGGDHAWGGGIDFKYFFRRYFGIGVEGFALNAHRGAGFDLESDGATVFIHERRSESRAVGELLELLQFVIPFHVLAFRRTSGLVAVSSGEVANEMKLSSMDSEESEQSRYRSIIPSITRRPPKL
jgi:hypothetical protein